MRLLLKASNITILVITLVNFYFLIQVRLNDYNGTNWQTVIYSDGKGYYEYLRAAFINHNLNHEDPKLGFMRETTGGPVIKFYAGTAIAESPFFCIAYIQSVFSNEPVNGYEYNFQRMIAIAGLIYCLLGLIFINRLLHELKIKDGIRVIVLILITYGTNLFYYAILEPSMSHVYSFAAIAAFIYFGFRYFRSFETKHLVIATVAFGLVVLIRPTNGIVLFILPFISGGWTLIRRYLKNDTHLFIFVAIILVFVFIQMYFWYLQCGRWFVWSYTGEGFYFLHPEIGNLLFSYKKGFFVYTPIALIAFVGFIPLYKRNRTAFYSILVTLLAAIYITASWWDWSYGDSYGMRPLVDFYSQFAVLLAVLLNSLKKISLIIFIPISFFFLLSTVQTYQYYNHILQHYSMDKDKYWYVFFKTGDRYKNILGGNTDVMPYSTRLPTLILKTRNDFEQRQSGWQANVIADDPLNNGGKSCSFDSNEIGLYFTLPFDSVPRNTEKIFIKASLRRYEFMLHSSSSAVLEASVERGAQHLFDYEFKLNDFPDDHPQQWRTYEYSFPIPIPNESFDNITIQIRNPAKQKFLIDDFEIRFYKVFQE